MLGIQIICSEMDWQPHGRLLTCFNYHALLYGVACKDEIVAYSWVAQVICYAKDSTWEEFFKRVANE